MSRRPVQAVPVPIGDVCLEVAEAGRGEPILFLHGALGDCRTWREHCGILSRRCRALSFTQRHFGVRPAGGDRPFGIDTHAADLIALIEALGLAPVALVAWSYGGHAAFQAALRRPDLFSRVLVYEPGFPTFVSDPEALAACERDAAALFGPVAAALEREGPEAAAAALIDGSAGRPGTFAAQPAGRRQVHLENAHSLPRLFAQTPPPAISAADLGGLRVPVSIAWGTRTRPAFAVLSRAAAAAITAARHFEVPGAGHLWPEEDAAGFTALVECWQAD